MQNGSEAIQLVIERIKQANNILVTVEKNPSVDELAGALALTLLLNKMEKRGTAVFSGTIPAAINFLEPSKTFEPTVDSLRDFIIALDKEKADRLRYKVEDDVVKIFITPYRAVLSSKDLQFSEGDFNVDVIVALGVQKKDSLDRAIAAHGRILHDATVITANNRSEQNELGAIDWQNPEASSICEMVVALADALDPNLLDTQISTALLTGIVAATDRFSNDHTNAHVMNIAAELMAAGANQQLIANNLQAKDQAGSDAVASESSIEDEILATIGADKKELPQESEAIDKKPAKKREKRSHSKETKSDDGGIEYPEKDEVAAESNKSTDDDKGALTVSHEPQAPAEEPDAPATDKIAQSENIPDEIDAPDAPAVQVEPSQDGLAAALESAAQNMPPMPSSATAAMPVAEPAPQVQESPLLPPAEPQTASLPQIRPLNQHTEGRAPWQELQPPTMGGTLNATAAEAADEKMRQAAEEEKKKVTLSHGSPIAPTTPSIPFDAAAANVAAQSQASMPEPALPPLPEPSAMPAMPPMPAPQEPVMGPLPEPSVAPEVSAPVAAPSSPDIDLETARQAVTTAFNEHPFDSAGRPLTDHAPQTMSDMPAPGALADGSMPPLPDFGNLPPLPAVQNLYSQPQPGQDVTSQFVNPDAPAAAPTLPTAQQAAAAPAPGQVAAAFNDPNQFHIPGQQPPQAGQ